jgi:hypothetical protein
MTLVAVTWLALQLAPAKQQGTWVAIAVAAYSLPSAAGALVFGRFLRGRIGWSSAAAVIAIDAATFAVLAATYRLALPRVVRADPVEAGASRAAGFAVIRHDRTLRGLLALTFAFFFLFGPVLVALPIHITQDLHGSATLLGPLD